MADPTRLTAVEMSKEMAAGTLTARAIAEAHLARIAAEDGAIGAFWHVDAAGALSAADAADARRAVGKPLSQFDGVPIAVKDNVDVAGLPATAGLVRYRYRHRIAAQDAFCVARLRAAGLVILGKLSMHEGALGATNDTPGFGRCQNPLKPGFTPGGSSGGSGAAVAAHFTPLAIGTDTMGSVRIPAAYCGVVGFKPSAGLVSRVGVEPLSSTLDTVGILARTPMDAGLTLQIMQGDDPDDPQSHPRAGSIVSVATGTLLPSTLRIGIPSGLDTLGIEPELQRGLHEAVSRLESMHLKVQSIAVDHWDPGRLRRAGLLVAEAEAALAHADLIDDPEGASPEFRAALRYGREASSSRLVAALATLEWARAGALRALATVDVLLLPTAPQRAFPHGTPVPANQADLTALANVAGLPAMSIPWPAPDGGLPLSLQIISGPMREEAVAVLAETLTSLGSAVAASR